MVCKRSATELRRDSTVYKVITTVNKNRYARSPGSIDYQLVPVLKHPGQQRKWTYPRSHKLEAEAVPQCAFPAFILQLGPGSSTLSKQG